MAFQSVHNTARAVPQPRQNPSQLPRVVRPSWLTLAAVVVTASVVSASRFGRRGDCVHARGAGNTRGWQRAYGDASQARMLGVYGRFVQLEERIVRNGATQLSTVSSDKGQWRGLRERCFSRQIHRSFFAFFAFQQNNNNQRSLSDARLPHRRYEAGDKVCFRPCAGGPTLRNDLVALMT